MIGVLNLARPTSAEVLRGLAGPMLIVMLLAMMVLPLPPFMLDMLFTFNIAFSIMVLLVGMNTVKPASTSRTALCPASALCNLRLKLESGSSG